MAEPNEVDQLLDQMLKGKTPEVAGGRKPFGGGRDGGRVAGAELVMKQCSRVHRPGPAS